MSREYSARQAGEKMGLPHREIIRRIRRGDIEAKKLGWVYVITEEAISAAMKSEWYVRNYSANS